MKIKKKQINGSMLLEIILATTIFVMLSGVIFDLFMQTRESQYNVYLYRDATQLLQEWMEALLSIKAVDITQPQPGWTEQSWFNTFTAGTHYLKKDINDNWLLGIEPEIIDIFQRKIIIEDVKRLDDGKGDISATWTGENLLPSGVVTKKVTVQLNWTDLNQQTHTGAITTYLVNWANPYIFSNF